jgi:hypothetical protein
MIAARREEWLRLEAESLNPKEYFQSLNSIAFRFCDSSVTLFLSAFARRFSAVHIILL